MQIQRIIRDYHEQLYANKMDKLENMDKFLEIYNTPRLNQCSSREEWIKKMTTRAGARAHTCTHKYHSALKNEILSSVTKWMELEGIMLCEVRQRKTNTV